MTFWYALRDIIIAILRLIMLQLVLSVTGLHHILFNRTEVSNIQLILIPQRRDRERLAFVDDLKAYNFDLMHNALLPPATCKGFVEDENVTDIEFNADDDDFDDFDDNDNDDFDDDDFDGGIK